MRQSLELSVEEGIIFLQSYDENITVRESGEEEKLCIGYMTLEKRMALKTLRSCPRIVRKWYAELQGLRRIKGYEPLPNFESTLDFGDVLEICLYFASKMIENERRSQEPTNPQMEDIGSNFFN